MSDSASGQSFSDIIKKRIEQKQLELLENEYSSARAEFRTALEAKDREIGEYEKKNQQLEKWVVDTQTRLETEVVSKQDLEAKLDDVKQAYWKTARENFEKLDARLAEYEAARSQILKLEEELQNYKSQLAEVQLKTKQKEQDRERRRAVKEQQLTTLINKHLAATLPTESLATKIANSKLLDQTPIFDD